MKTEDTLQEALTYAGCPELPAVEKDGDVWINAIAFVKKTNGSSAYVIMGRSSKTGEKTIVKDIGDIAGIHTIVSIHPYKFLKESFIPDCKTKEEFIAFLSYRTKTDRTFFEGLSNEQIRNRIYAEAIKDQNSREQRDRNESCYSNKVEDGKFKDLYDIERELKASKGNQSISASNKQKEKQDAKERAEKRAKGSKGKTSK